MGPWIDDLRLLEGIDGTGPIIEHTTDPLTGAPSEALRAAIRTCLAAASDRPAP